MKEDEIVTILNQCSYLLHKGYFPYRDILYSMLEKILHEKEETINEENISVFFL